MQLYNIRHPEEVVSFREAVTRGIGSDGGLFFPQEIPILSSVEALLEQDFVSRSVTILKAILGDSLSATAIERIVSRAFNFPIQVRAITDQIFALELFWGPTLAFKDFGARLMAQILSELGQDVDTDQPITILTATSGDTGAAVAHAFHQVPKIQVVILYPNHRISELQEKLFCTLGGNVHTLAVQGDFDACQSLVKQCFTDPALCAQLRLNSANSINISRILAQCLYYFEAVAQLPKRACFAISVPSGNFGNLTAGLFAQQMGLPVPSWIAATNANDTVPRYLRNQRWEPRETVSTISNAMDVSQPNNWPRIEELFRKARIPRPVLSGISISEEQTQQALRDLSDLGYIADPHSAVAYAGLRQELLPWTCDQKTGVFLCTAHPAKFKPTVDTILNRDIPLPKALSDVAHKPILSHLVPNNLQALKTFLWRLVSS